MATGHTFSRGFEEKNNNLDHYDVLNLRIFFLVFSFFYDIPWHHTNLRINIDKIRLYRHLENKFKKSDKIL